MSINRRKLMPETFLQFEDAEVLKVCIDNFGRNGGVTKEQIASVTASKLGQVFRGNQYIVSFDEFKYFTGVKNIPSFAFADCPNLTTLTLPTNVEDIGEQCFINTPCFIDKDVVSRNGHGYQECIVKSILVTGDAYLTYNTHRINCCPSVTILGNLVLQGSTGTTPNMCFYSPNADTRQYRIKFLSVGGTVTGGNIFFANNAYSLQNKTILHFGYEGIACPPTVACASFSYISKIYVGNGSSAAHDNAILNQYVSDSAWSAYTSKLDTWYNYKNQ